MEIQETSVIQMKDYGKITIKLDAILKDRNISRNRLATLINVRYSVVTKWCSGSLERMDTDLLARVCFVLNCEVSDIVEYSRPTTT